MKRTALSAFLAASLFALGCEETKPTPATSGSTVPSAATAPASAAPVASSAATDAPPAPAYEPAAFELDVSHSKIGFSVKHMMVANTRGQFAKYGGTIFIDEKDPSKTVIDVAIDTDSIDTGDKKRDDHLRGPDFFDAKKWPKMTFKSTKVERKGAGWAVTGDLTIRDKTKSVVLDVEPLSPEAKDPWGGIHRGTRATAKINRMDFDLKWNKSLETGGVLVGEDVNIELDIELLKKVGNK